ncbi:hypothetical protein [Rhizorhapis sp. SPR117]|uniref:hypothetical protein n=1 Tax=Rhizorhapis sp. SPR117 TaxID=2912611 RepID=UPI001F3C0AF3|nr:hypothetical protein [Rhizorhapis sp. SPR117]
MTASKSDFALQRNPIETAERTECAVKSQIGDSFHAMRTLRHNSTSFPTGSSSQLPQTLDRLSRVREPWRNEKPRRPEHRRYFDAHTFGQRNHTRVERSRLDSSLP